MGQLFGGTVMAANRVFEAINITPNICVAALICAAGAWAWGGHSGNYKLSSQGRTGLMWALVALVIVGSANALANWALGISIGV